MEKKTNQAPVEEKDEEVEIAPEEVKIEVKDETPKMSLTQFCSGVSARVPVETLSVFYELEMEAGRTQGTVEEFQQRLEEFRNRPL